MVIALAVVMVIVAVLVGLFGSRTVRGAGERAKSPVSGDRTAWTSVVCSDYSVVAPSTAFPLVKHATNVNYCMTPPSANSGPQSVVIGEWPVAAAVVDDLAKLPRVRWYATADLSDRTTAFILQNSADRSLLEPLARFGFVIASR